MNKNCYIISTIILLVVTIGLILHNIETTALVRCDGKDIYPYTKEDNVTEGKMKLDNAILSHIGGHLELYEPVNTGATWIKFQKGCKYVTVGDWVWR